MLVHTDPIGMYKKIEEKVKEVISLQKLTYVVFLHFKSDIVIKMGRVGFRTELTLKVGPKLANQIRLIIMSI
jgi:flavorubredoxin